ncbi:MAG: DUF115 domain-containing protein [Lachnospiraceae bacterium]|nr:DUF115 domain-containing protein [Lachnospiraceae bacterium]
MRINELITELKNIIYVIRVQDYTGAKFKIERFLKSRLEDDSFADELSGVFGLDNVKVLLADMIRILEAGDMILLADMLESVCIPALEKANIGEESIDRGRYTVESTLSGYYTVKDGLTNIYLHSNNDPMEEAKMSVTLFYDPHRSEYAVWGCGLGYHVLQLMELSDGTITVKVYEEDEPLINLAHDYGVYDLLPENSYEIIHDPDGTGFSKTVADGSTGIYMHFPSIKKIADEKLKNGLHRFFLGWNGTVQIKNNLAVNFRKNVMNCKGNICECSSDFDNSEIVIVAAGPSVTPNIDFLKKSKEEGRKIIVVATILKRILECGIVPDYAVVMDSYMGTYDQMNGVNDISSYPFIIDSTAYWKFAENHLGFTYLVLQEGYGAAEKLASELGYTTFATGGSVTTLALSIALKMGASKIYLVGADMAYKNGASHSEGTASYHKENTDNMIPVEGVSGEIVYTTILLDSYRNWIEQEIMKYPDIPVINMSDCGALIKGTRPKEEY